MADRQSPGLVPVRRFLQCCRVALSSEKALLEGWRIRNAVAGLFRLVEEGSLPKRTAKELAAKLKDEIQPLKVLAILRRDIKREFFQASPAAHASQALAPHEVILSSWLVQPADG